MNISQIRSLLYNAAKYLGDISAIKRAITSGSLAPLVKRILRRIYGRFTSRGFNSFK